jgi:hypothetical protein
MCYDGWKSVYQLVLLSIKMIILLLVVLHDESTANTNVFVYFVLKLLKFILHRSLLGPLVQSCVTSPLLVATR